ncbi:hypothetical protein RRF57_009217 [Xylaria bambusicola]|uniref:Zn(2)-C6 fungal-type domain-containing protein n=1 Tax=Xylaria bambusicola TaxID=326684 RepID=A0AAN7ZBU2_9PEZI
MERQKNLVQRPREAFLFVVNGEASVEAASPDPDPADHGGRPGRKRPHHKSRRGCLVCKQRRVKCDEQFPCSNCLKRHERCIRSNAAGSRKNELSTRISQPLNTLMVEDTSINLLHLELFFHFQRGLVDTLVFSEIWEQVLPWSFQEPYVMCSILCLAAIHLSTLQPQSLRYSNVAVQLLGKSASLFNDKLSRPVTAQNSEAVIAVSILMHYISWSYIRFVDKRGKFQYQKGNSPLMMYLSKDPLLQLSFGVQGILNDAFRILMGSDSVFLTTGLYSPIYAIEEAILQQGEDPWRFVHRFMEIPDEPHRQPPDDHLSSYKEKPIGCLWSHEHGCNAETALGPPQEPPNPRQVAFEGIAKRLSLLFCLVSMSPSTGNSASQALTRLQPDIERCFFSFPVHYSSAFRELALRGDSRALIILCHFYRAARILLTGPRTWWARQRSRIIECLILEDLTLRGLDRYVIGEGF